MMGLDDVFRDGKTESGSLAPARSIDFVKALEETPQFLRRNAGAGIGDRDDQLAFTLMC